MSFDIQFKISKVKAGIMMKIEAKQVLSFPTVYVIVWTVVSGNCAVCSV